MAACLLAPREQGDLLRTGVYPVNTYQFFNQNFGRFLTAQTNNPYMDAWRALSSTHPLVKKNKNGEEQAAMRHQPLVSWCRR